MGILGNRGASGGQMNKPL